MPDEVKGSIINNKSSTIRIRPFEDEFQLRTICIIRMRLMFNRRIDNSDRDRHVLSRRSFLTVSGAGVAILAANESA